MRLPDRAYNFLKWTCLIALPALAVFYAVIAKIWGLPYGAEIAGTITAIATFLGTILQISNAKYKVKLLQVPEEEEPSEAE